MNVSEGWILLICLGCFGVGCWVGNLASDDYLQSHCADYGKYTLHMRDHDVTLTCEAKKP